MYQTNMLVFASETSCDETSICLMEDNKIIEHVIFSQEIHNNHGGVVPELASRAHLEKIQEITAEKLSVDIGDVKPESSFTEDLEADSLDVVELIMALEEEFSTDEKAIEISDEDAENIRTVQDAVDYISSKV